MIVGYGTVALDTVETPAGRSENTVGGSAIYFAGAASLQVPVGVLGVAGSDYPWSALDPLAARGVDVGGLELRDGCTMAWRARYDAAGERWDTSTDRGVAGTGPPLVPDRFRGADLLFLGSTDPADQAAVLEGVSPAGPVVLDTMGHWIRDRRTEVLNLVAQCDLLLVTATEALALAAVGTGGDAGRDGSEAIDAARSLLDAGPSWVVLKHGARGATAHAREGFIRVPAVPGIRPVDPSGAGDALAGGIVARLGPPPWDQTAMADALLHGAASAALAVSNFGIAGLVEADATHLAEGVQRLEHDGPLD